VVEIRAPLVANIDLTNRCNLHCSYCYAAGRDIIDIPTDTCVSLIDELAVVHGVFHITLAGGEPLLHPGIMHILKEGFSRHGGKLVLLTNGTRLTDDAFFKEFKGLCEELSSTGKRLEMQISLDSQLPEIHNLQRDQGYQVLEAIERAISLPITLQLACVVTRYNVHCAHEIINTFYPRIKNFHYMNIMPSIGRSTGQRYRDLLPSKEQVEKFHQLVLECERRCHQARITKIVRDREEGGSIRGCGCLAGTTRIDIAPDLTVMACCMSNEVLGNLARQSFNEMWFSDQAEQIRSVEKPYCFKWAK
jgi:MoaA/NifB/PqqE/SkfB family radical SAM enzyme